MVTLIIACDVVERQRHMQEVTENTAFSVRKSNFSNGSDVIPEVTGNTSVVRKFNLSRSVIMFTQQFYRINILKPSSYSWLIA